MTALVSLGPVHLDAGKRMGAFPCSLWHEDGRHDFVGFLAVGNEPAQINPDHLANPLVNREVAKDFGHFGRLDHLGGANSTGTQHCLNPDKSNTGQVWGRYHKLSQFIPPQLRDCGD